MTQTLPQLANETNRIVSMILEYPDGDLPDALVKELDAIEVSVKDKIDGYYHITERLKMETEYWKKQADNYLRVSKACKAARERLTGNIRYAMQKMELTEIKGNTQRFVLSKVKPKLEVDEDKLPSAYFMQKVDILPDKERIRKALENGEEIEGAKLCPCNSLRTYVNRDK